jgi:hypothetical protein
VRSSSRIAGAVATLVAAAGLSLALVGTAQAATCAHTTISPGVQGPTLSPKSVTINAGGCSAYVDNTPLAVKVSVAKLSAVAQPNGQVAFFIRTPGTYTVTVQQQFQGQGVGGTGNGTLVVRAAPAPKPSPSKSVRPSPHPTPASSSAQPTATPSSTGPVVAPTTPAPPSAPGVTPTPQQSGQGNPPVIVGIPPPTTTPSPAPEAVSRAQIQPPSGRAAGLPAAVAAMLLVGAGAAFVRVLLAEPVRLGPGGAGDDRRFIPRPS